MPRTLVVRAIVLVTSLLFVSPAAAQEQHTQHTKKLATGQRAAPARIEDLAWLAGRWRLVPRLKHFNPDLTGWEEKDRFVEFAFVAKTDDAIYFSGLTYQRVGRDELRIYLAMREQGRELREETFTFRRAR
ncbi:MAG: hypothetical protein IT353_06175 [Gemmatimonadaceae bacterium]|nr:hypothetical protein [Gemmatimonadaceae bacterium]